MTITFTDKTSYNLLSGTTPDERLKIAVIDRAVKDYKSKNTALRDDAIYFLLSEYYSLMSTLDPMVLMQKADGLKNYNKWKEDMKNGKKNRAHEWTKYAYV